MRKRLLLWALLGLPVAALLTAALLLAHRYNLLPHRTFTDADFGITPVASGCDFNQNGKDDYQDLLLGARKDAQNKPRYDGAYQAGGYPPENIGVCTDVVWRAFREAGYSLKEMVSKDIAARPEAYNVENPDGNIDFRRVPNLEVFFQQYAQSLTTDPNEIAQWQAGDLVMFGGRHVGIVSDKRTKEGAPYIIHNGGQPNREEDYLKRDVPTAHYRFKPQTVPPNILSEWE